MHVRRTTSERAYHTAGVSLPALISAPILSLHLAVFFLAKALCPSVLLSMRPVLHACMHGSYSAMLCHRGRVDISEAPLSNTQSTWRFLWEILAWTSGMRRTFKNLTLGTHDSNWGFVGHLSCRQTELGGQRYLHDTFRLKCVLVCVCLYELHLLRISVFFFALDVMVQGACVTVTRIVSYMMHTRQFRHENFSWYV